MPRDSNGNYILPAGNPVVSGTVISTSWANPTMQDIAVEITNSLDRQGRGGMLAPFKFADGTVGAPSLTFTNEPTSGIYRFGPQDIRVSIVGQDQFRVSNGAVQVWDAAALPSPAFSTVANQNQINAINTTLGNVALLTASNVFTGVQQIIQNSTGAFAIFKDATPTIAARFSINNYYGDGVDISLYSSSVWRPKLAATAALTTLFGTTHDFATADGSVVKARFNFSTSEFYNSVVSQNSNPAYYWKSTAAAVDNRNWAAQMSGSEWQLLTLNDAIDNGHGALAIARSGIVVTSMTYSSAGDNTSHTFHGDPVVRSNTSNNFLWLMADGSAADNRRWGIRNSAGNFTIGAWNDAVSIVATGYQIARTAANVSAHYWYTGVNSLTMTLDVSGISLPVNKTLYIGGFGGITEADSSAQKALRMRDKDGFRGGLMYWYDTALLNGFITYGTGAPAGTGSPGNIYLQIT